MPLSRRDLLLGAAALVPLPVVARRFHGLAVQGMDPAVLRALAQAVLPSELGAAGLERAVTAFEQWLAGYKEGAEMLHGYGTGELHVTGPSPAVRWRAQLAALGAGFRALSVAQRQDAVRAALADYKPGPLPEVDAAPHVALGLMAHFYGSAAGHDLCYLARIGQGTCRPLAQAPERPAPLKGS